MGRQGRRGKGGGEGVSSHRILTDGDCLCWLMATYVAHTSHYGAVLGPRTPLGPLLSPWLRRRRVMANTLRIKCILSPSALMAPLCNATTVLQITFTFTSPRSMFLLSLYHCYLFLFLVLSLF